MHRSALSLSGSHNPAWFCLQRGLQITHHHINILLSVPSGEAEKEVSNDIHMHDPRSHENLGYEISTYVFQFLRSSYVFQHLFLPKP